MSTPTPIDETPIPTPSTNYLHSLSVILATTDREILAQSFAELADEALVLAAESRTAEWFRFWGDLHEKFHWESQRRLPAEPKPARRRWWKAVGR